MMSIYEGIEFNYGPRGPVALDSSALSAFCAKNHIFLPDDYISFLHAVNGGKPFYPKNEVRLKYQELRGKVMEKEVYAFHPFVMHQSYTAQPSIWKVGNLKRPKFLFEIAVLVGDAEVYMGVSKSLSGQIFLLNLKKSKLNKVSVESELDDDSGVVKVANSFTEFIGGLDILKK